MIIAKTSFCKYNSILMRDPPFLPPRAAASANIVNEQCDTAPNKQVKYAADFWLSNVLTLGMVSHVQHHYIEVCLLGSIYIYA